MSAEAAVNEALVVPWSPPAGMPPFINPAELPADVLRPTLPVDVIGPARTATGRPLIDSGSPLTVFPASIMAILGIDVEMCGNRGTLEYVGTGPRPILEYPDGLEIQVGERWAVRLAVRFMAVDDRQFPGVLGLDFVTAGFRITLDGVARVTIIEGAPALAVPASESGGGATVVIEQATPATA